MSNNEIVKKLVDSYGDWFKKEDALKYTEMVSGLYPYKSIFSPITVNKLTIKNRLVMAPMGNVSMCDETGRPNAKMIEYFYERAKGGVGLITTGLIPISHGIDTSITELGKLSYFPRIDRSRTVFAGWRDLVQGVHSYGSRIFIQLTPGLGRVGNPQCLITMKKFPKSASMNPNYYISQIPCMPLSNRSLKKIIKNMGQGAADAKVAGFDGAYLHGHEGYLLEQLTNTAFNRRSLGRYSNWQAFGIDCVAEMRKRVGPNFPIMYRIDLSLALNETYGVEEMKQTGMKKFTKGRTADETIEFMENLVKAGVDIFDVDLGCYDNWWLPHPPSSMPPGCFLEVSELVKKHFKEKGILSNAGVEVPIVAVGKLGYPDLAENALREEKCDMVMLGRPLLADPDWPNKAFAGKVEDIRPCIGCQEGCINEFVEGGHPQCAVNPRTAFEHEFPDRPIDAETPLKIGVVGAGPAGITAAVTAAKRGHKVELLEKSSDIGGRTIPGSVGAIKYEFANYKKYLKKEIDDTEKDYELTYTPNFDANIDNLKKKGFDKIVFAIGGKDIIPKISGLEEANTVLATDLLVKPELLGKAKKIVVVGGGVVGCETAYWLKYEKDAEVTVVEMEKYIMNHTCTANRGHIIHYLKRAGVKLLNCTKVIGFSKEGVTVERNVSKSVPNPYLTWNPILPENIENPLAPKLKYEMKEELLEADLVVLAMGNAPDEALYFQAQSEGLAGEIYNIGDSFSRGRVHDATRSAYRLAIKL